MIYLIVLNWNNYEDTTHCLDSLFKITRTEFKIILVDNGSTDGSMHKIIEWAQHHFNSQGEKVFYASNALYNFKNNEMPIELILIGTPYNLGYSGGNNVGIKYAEGKDDCTHICVLNNDVIVDSSFLDKSLDCFDDEAIGIVSPLIAYWPERNKIWYAGGRRFFGNAFHFQRGLNIADADLVKRKINFATGCAFLARKEVFQKAGSFRKEIFLYGEDIEFSKRVCKKGYEIVFCPESVIYHKVSNISGEETFNENFLYYGRRNIKYIADNFIQKVIYFLVDLVIFVFPVSVKIIMLKSRNKQSLFKALIRGMEELWK